MHVVIGIGSADHDADDRIRGAITALRKHPDLRVLAASARYLNPPAGGVTAARFINAAVVVDTALSLPALVRALHAIERAAGRVRAPSMARNGPRTLDLDVLWSLEALAPSTSPDVPHPRVLGRAFAVVPAVEALRRARLPVPAALVEAARLHAQAPLLRVDVADIATG